jgi:PAS domain S-box-containing protein
MPSFPVLPRRQAHIPFLTLTKQGAKVWIEVSTRLIYQNGLPVGFQGIARNITERKYMTDALKEAEKEKELIL